MAMLAFDSLSPSSSLYLMDSRLTTERADDGLAITQHRTIPSPLDSQLSIPLIERRPTKQKIFGITLDEDAFLALEQFVKDIGRGWADANDNHSERSILRNGSMMLFYFEANRRLDTCALSVEIQCVNLEAKGGGRMRLHTLTVNSAKATQNPSINFPFFYLALLLHEYKLPVHQTLDSLLNGGGAMINMSDVELVLPCTSKSDNWGLFSNQPAATKTSDSTAPDVYMGSLKYFRRGLANQMSNLFGFRETTTDTRCSCTPIVNTQSGDTSNIGDPVIKGHDRMLDIFESESLRTCSSGFLLERTCILHNGLDWVSKFDQPAASGV